MFEFLSLNIWRAKEEKTIKRYQISNSTVNAGHKYCVSHTGLFIIINILLFLFIFVFFCLYVYITILNLFAFLNKIQEFERIIYRF